MGGSLVSVLVYTHANPMVVQYASQLLQENGIACELRNEFVTSVIGSGAACDAWPEIWVAQDEEHKAKKLIEEMTLESQGDPWKCEVCGEINEKSFDFCWRCHSGDDDPLP